MTEYCHYCKCDLTNIVPVHSRYEAAYQKQGTTIFFCDPCKQKHHPLSPTEEAFGVKPE